MDGRNPFRTTLKPWETMFCWYLQGNQIIPGFLGWGRISSIHSTTATSSCIHWPASRCHWPSPERWLRKTGLGVPMCLEHPMPKAWNPSEPGSRLNHFCMCDSFEERWHQKACKIVSWRGCHCVAVSQFLQLPECGLCRGTVQFAGIGRQLCFGSS